jgi:hypothetical protein
MATIKPFYLSRCRTSLRADESMRFALSWIFRPSPGIKWQPVARAEINRPERRLTSFQPHHYPQRKKS